MYCLLPRSGLSLYCGKAGCLEQDSLTASPWGGWGGGGGGGCRTSPGETTRRTRRQDSPESTVMPGATALQEGRERDQAQLETIPGSEVITWGQGERMMQALTPRLPPAWETPCYPEMGIGWASCFSASSLKRGPEEAPWEERAEADNPKPLLLLKYNAVL